MVQKGNVVSCPVTKEEWDTRAALKQADCGGKSVYHCLADSLGWKWESCVQRSLIKKGHCPIFTADKFIDWKSCNTSIPTCPNSSYVSDEVYKYPECFGNNTAHESLAEDPSVPGDEDPSVGSIIAIVVSISIIAIIAVIAFLVIYRRKRHQKNPENMDETEGLMKENITDMTKDGTVRNGLKALSRKDGKSLFVHGKFGNTVSSTSRRIIEKFVKNNEGWKALEFRYTDIPDNVEENTIMFVYGWFGLWNDDPCSVEKVKKACQDLNHILHKGTNVKIIIGMRSEHHRKYHGCFARSPLFRNELSLDAENSDRDDEHYEYFINKIKEPCKKTECHCHDLKFETFRDDLDSEIGIPLKMNVLERYHNVIDDYVVKHSLLNAMTEHISSLEGDDETKSIYQWIMYICIKGQFNRSMELDDTLIKTMGFAIKASSFDEQEERLSRYIRIRNSDKQKMVPPESAQYVFWHPFIYICAFHSLFRKNPDNVMKYCNIDAILQLVRPEKNIDTYLEVRADNTRIDLFNQRIQTEGLQDQCEGHPLVAQSAEAEKNINDDGKNEEEPIAQQVLIVTQMTMTM